MAVYEGRLKRLGAGSVRQNLKNGYVLYSTLEIGDEVLTDVLISTKLDTFLSDGLQTADPTKISVIRQGWGTTKAIASVQVGNGKKYKFKPFSISGIIFLWVFALLFLAISVINGLKFFSLIFLIIVLLPVTWIVQYIKS